MDPQELTRIFKAVDKDNDGDIDASELQAALSNGTWVPFNPATIKLMIRMFDRRGVQRIQLEEFGALWKYVVDWQNCFKAFDQDGSGFIDVNELKIALSTFGYRINPEIVSTLVAKFDRHKNGTLAFDDFIHCCIKLHTITEAFKEMDQDRDGVVTVGYEQFINLCIQVLHL